RAAAGPRSRQGAEPEAAENQCVVGRPDFGAVGSPSFGEIVPAVVGAVMSCAMFFRSSPNHRSTSGLALVCKTTLLSGVTTARMCDTLRRDSFSRRQISSSASFRIERITVAGSVICRLMVLQRRRLFVGCPLHQGRHGGPLRLAPRWAIHTNRPTLREKHPAR